MHLQNLSSALARLCRYIHSFIGLVCLHFDASLFPFRFTAAFGPGGVGTGTASVCTESWKIQNISEKIYAISERKRLVYLGVGSLNCQSSISIFDSCRMYFLPM
jgi:hypothetical protein